MNPFKLKTRTQVEEEVRKAREESDGEVSDIFGLGDELVDMIRTQPVSETPLAPARPMTKSEATEVEADLISFRLFDEPADPIAQLSEPFRKMAEEQQREDLEKLVGPARAAQTRQERLVSRELERQLRENVLVGKLPGRTPDTGSELLLRFLKSYGENDDAGMRQVVRQLVAA